MGPEALGAILSGLPKTYSENLLIGYDSSDDAAVYKLTDDLAIVQTLDFFTPVVEEPYLFGKIAAANALSDVYAMGGEVKVALNIVGFPETMDMSILGEILRGGAEKVAEAGGVLSGGHSINDDSPKYGLSVTGTVHPDKILANNNCKVGDKIILTKPIGVGIVMTAWRLGQGKESGYLQAVKSMETLNKYAADVMKNYNVNACTDVTGFGLLGHLGEMIPEGMTAVLNSSEVPYIEGAYDLAKEFYITGSGQKNANFMDGKILMGDVDFALTELLYDPQTSGGLLISLPGEEADGMLSELRSSGIDAREIAEIRKYSGYAIVCI